MKRLAGTVVAALLAAMTVFAAPAAQATGSFCQSTAGVNVAVDFHQLGGGIRKGCDANGGGRSAGRIFSDAGVTLSFVQGSRFVCRVDQKPGPSPDPCVRTPPANAYWGLFWARKGASSWSYSSLGVDGLTVPAGASVALSWQGSSTQTPPGVKPPQPPAPPKQPPPKQPKPSKQPQPSKSPTPSSAATPSHSASATPKAGGKDNKPRRHPSPRPSPSASATPLAGVATGPPPSASPRPAAAHPGGGPPATLWVSLGLVVLMMGTAAVLVARGRR